MTGLALADVLREYMDDMKIDNGLTALGFTKEDIPALVRGTLPQVGSLIMSEYYSLELVEPKYSSVCPSIHSYDSW